MSMDKGVTQRCTAELPDTGHVTQGVGWLQDGYMLLMELLSSYEQFMGSVHGWKMWQCASGSSSNRCEGQGQGLVHART